jgi:hypothetical protein
MGDLSSGGGVIRANQLRFGSAALAVALAACAAPYCYAADPPAATQPAFAGPAMLQVMERIHFILQNLDLTEAQKRQITPLEEHAREQIVANRQTIKPDGAGSLMNAQRAVIEGFRENLIPILTPAQRLEFRDRFQSDIAVGGNRGGGGLSPTTLPTAPLSSRIHVADKSIPDPLPTTLPDTAAVGMSAPPFDLQTPGLVHITSSHLKGQVVVLLFGSLTCTTFRDHAIELERLKQKYGARSFFLWIYTRENHPAGGWEVARNQDDGISVTEPKTLQQRLGNAETARVDLHMTVTVVADTMDDSAARAYGGYPNAAVVIDRQGNIAGRQQWVDPSDLGGLIEAAIAEK